MPAVPIEVEQSTRAYCSCALFLHRH